MVFLATASCTCKTEGKSAFAISDVKKRRRQRSARVRRDIVGAPLALIKERRTLRARTEISTKVKT